MQYKKFCDVYERLGATTKRLEKTKILADFLQKLSNEDKKVLYLLQGRVFPDYEEKVMGISHQLAIKSLARATGNNENEITNQWRKIGDLGKVAEALTKTKKQSTLFSHKLTTKKVFDNLRRLSELQGAGTVSKKISLISELLTSASGVEAKYIIRTLIGDLRIGVKSSTIRDALSLAFFSESERKEAVSEIQHAYDMSPDLAQIFELAKKGRKSLSKISLEAGKPIKVMLAQKAKSIQEAFEKCGKPLAAEYKYDGFRMMINKKGKNIILYTRRLDNVTKQFPDIVKSVKKYIKGQEFIVDSEIIGYNPKTKKYVPFQQISQRIRRKYEIERMMKELPVEVKAFDIIYYNGRNLIKEPFAKRTKLLKKIIKNKKYKITTADQKIIDNEKEVQDFYNQAIKDNQEGLMLKNLKAPYKPGSRVGYILKLKKELRDLDLTIVGAEYGKGKRVGWLSSFILACKGKKGEYLTIGKMGTGIKEKKESVDAKEPGISFNQLTKLLKKNIIEEKGRGVKIKPQIVVSVTFQEIQKSPTYSSGYALRFPRFTALRSDRKVSDIATLREVEKDYEAQGEK